MYILYNQNKVSWSLKLVFNDEGYLPFNFHNEKYRGYETEPLKGFISFIWSL
jgi:hypothetical protein